MVEPRRNRPVLSRSNSSCFVIYFVSRLWVIFIINYDVPLIKEQFPDFAPTGKMVDTLVLSRLYYPHIAERDYERRPVGMPQRLYGRHSLEAWGYRLKCFKGDFGKSDSNDWSTYTPEMLDYCIQDTQVTLRLYELLKRRMQDYA